MDRDDKAEPLLTYYDLNLRFCGYNDKAVPPTFKVYFEGDTRAGSIPPDDAVMQKYNAEKFWDDSTEYTGGLMEELESGQISQSRLLKLGRLLTELALPGKVLELFKKNLETLKAGEGLRLRLRIDISTLARLPWEYMILTDRAPGEDKVTDFLALRSNISIVRTGTVYEKMSGFAPSFPIRIAGVLSNPAKGGAPDEVDLPILKVDEDKDAINKLVAELRRLTGDEYLEEVRWAPRPATIEAPKTVLEEPADIFYYAGHARFDLLQDGQLILEKENGGGEYYASQNLIELLKKAHVRLVILNACETAYGDKKKRWSGSASNLEREQIPIVIGNQFDIDDEHARLLAENIFKYLFIGYTIDQALYEARKAINDKNGEIHRNWGVPVLYLRGLVVNPVFFPKQKSKIRQNFYERALDCYQAMKTVQDKINKVCEPFVSGKPVGSDQRDEVTASVNDLNPHIDKFRNLLGEIQLGWFAEVDASKIDASLLRRYQIMVDLDYLEEQWEVDLDVHLAGFPLDSQKRARRDQCNQIRKDLEQLQEKMNAIQIAYIDLLKPADIEDTNKVNV